jgi:hypothetical protein
MCGRLQRGEYGQQSELALIACKYNLEIIVFENGTQQWIQKPTGTHQQKHVITLRWCCDSIHYNWLKLINFDEPKRVNPLLVSLKLGPTFTASAKCNRILHQPGSSAVGLNLKDTDNLSPSMPKDSYRTRQTKKILAAVRFSELMRRSIL